MWMKEYYPEDWGTLKKHVAAGRRRLSGSWINAVDVNMPSPESLFRHALYAQRFLPAGVLESQPRHLSA